MTDRQGKSRALPCTRQGPRGPCWSGRPRGIWCQGCRFLQPEGPPSWSLKRVGLDTSRAVFTVHGVDHAERVVVRRDLKRAALEAFFAKLPATVVALEACGASHHWGRRLTALGHEVRLIPRAV